MRKSLLILVFVAVALIAMSGMGFAGTQDFGLTNSTGVTLVEINVSPAGVNSWESNVLDGRPLIDGDTMVVTFHGYNPSVATWDLKATSADSVSIAWYGLLLNNILSITLNADGSATLQ